MDEIKHISAYGMLLQNATSLSNRVSCLEESALIDADVAQLLINNNKADDSNRANTLWFCFYEPFLAGQSGIEPFFRFWGGEALYSSHKGNPLTGNTLLSIGIPCIIKAKVAIASLTESYYPDSSMIREFLLQRGHQIEKEIDHEAFSTKKIDPQDIIGIIKHPSDQFTKLTKCDEWETSGVGL